jgi:hypothetical protein
MTIYSLIGLLSTIIAWIVIAQVAPSRGRRVWPWAVLAFFIGVFSLIPLYLMPNLSGRPSTA